MTSARPRVVFLCHGGEESPAADRARAFAARLEGEVRATVVLRPPSRLRATATFGRTLAAERPDLTYVVDVSPPGVLAGLAARAVVGGRVVVDTGDAVHALARSAAMRGPAGLALTWLLEQTALRGADHVVTRGGHHAELLRARGLAATAIPDGVDVARFRPADARDVRARLAPGADLVVGIVGSLAWNPRVGACYGWDLVEALSLLPPGVRGLVVGDGSGLAWLRERARTLGVLERLTFVGRVRLDELPPLLNAMDVGLSTQTNDLVGQVRTTGKLPLYLATGRFVLASRVGEAARVLDDEQLLEFHGAWDPSYPTRLAERLRGLLAAPERLAAAGARNAQLARERFAYDVLAPRVLEVMEHALTRRL